MEEMALTVDDGDVGEGNGYMVIPMNEIITKIKHLPSKKLNIEVCYMQALVDKMKGDILKPLTTEDIPDRDSL